MINELKQLLTMIQDVPDMVMHVLIGFAAYKIIIFLGTSAGIYGTIRLAVNKFHDYKIKSLEAAAKPKEFKLQGHFINESNVAQFLSMVEDMKRSTGQYVHSSDLAWFREAIREKAAKEKAK